MAWSKTNFDGVLIFTPKIWNDPRGYFLESYNESSAPPELGTFVQDNEAKSTKGVLRGLHYQYSSAAQAKLVRVVTGEVLDVIVDIRPYSPTYGKHLSVILNDINKKQLYVPRGFAHGYIVLSDEAIFAYKCDNFYNSNLEAGILYNDPSLAIDWILDESDYIISDKDLNQPLLGQHTPFE